jgi:hypothetical protein
LKVCTSRRRKPPDHPDYTGKKGGPLVQKNRKSKIILIELLR